jgi:hypothetical protein
MGWLHNAIGSGVRLRMMRSVSFVEEGTKLDTMQ